MLVWIECICVVLDVLGKVCLLVLVVGLLCDVFLYVGVVLLFEWV